MDIVSFTIISLYAQHVTTSFLVNGTLFYGSFIYASTSLKNRQALWNSLSDLSIQGPWFAIGDFNVVLGAHETSGNPSTSSCMDFRTAISLCNWVELDSQGSFHTWHGSTASGIVLFRLDRAFCIEVFLDSWSQVSSLCLHRISSDHHPLLLHCIANSPRPSKSFRFMEMWIHHDTFMDLVKDV